MRRLKVLVSAYACSPYEGSEGAVGWGLVTALAQYHDLWVIVEEEKFREDIERFLGARPDLGDSIHFLFLHKKRNRLLRKLWPPSYYWYYRRWHQDTYEFAAQLHKQVHFDLAHQMTMVGFREPGYLWKLGIPFVWGPVGGMGLFPWRFLFTVGLTGAIYYTGYNLFNLFHMRYLRRPREAAEAAGSGLVAATPENIEGARKYWQVPHANIVCEVGLPRQPIDMINRRPPSDSFRIVWSGLHLPGKALNLGLQAASRMTQGVGWELHILGHGPRTGQWQRYAVRLGIMPRCRFHGWKQRDEALQIMCGAHVMLITSLRDLTSTVTIEAMALGLPIICLDHCGFAEAVDESCGIKIPVTNPRQVVKDLARALERLALDEPFRQGLAKGALARSFQFSWEHKAKLFDEIYRFKTQGELREPIAYEKH